MRAIDADALKKAVCEFVHQNDGETPCPNQITSCLWSGVRICDFNRIINDALTIQCKPARVLTLEEMRETVDHESAARMLPYAWVEMSDELYVSRCVDVELDGNKATFAGWHFDAGLYLDSYGETWRVWTWQPTPDQMMNTPWEV